MITQTLQTLKVIKKGEEAETTDWVSQGVTQGSPLSRILFNVYMDSYTESMEKTGLLWGRSNGKERLEISIFADDGKIQTTLASFMNTFLRKPGVWAKAKGVKWSTNSCQMIAGDNTNQKETFLLAGERLRVTDKATYLVVTATSEGVKDHKSIDRIRKARNNLQMKVRAGVSKERMPANNMTDVVQSMVTPIVMFAIHPIPLTECMMTE